MLNNKSYRDKAVAQYFDRYSTDANINGEIFSEHFKKLENGQEKHIGRKKEVGIDGNGLPVYQKIKDDVQFSGKGYYSFSNIQKPEFPANAANAWDTNNWKVRVIARVGNFTGTKAFISNGFNIASNTKGVWFGINGSIPYIYYTSGGIELIAGITGMNVPLNTWFEVVYERISSTQLRVTLDGVSQTFTPINLSTYSFGDATYPIWLTGDAINNYGNIDLALIECSVNDELVFANYFEEIGDTLYNPASNTFAAIPSYLSTNWGNDLPDQYTYSHINQKGYNTYFKPPSNGVAISTTLSLGNISNYSIVGEFIAQDTSPTYGGVIISLGTSVTYTSISYKHTTERFDVYTNGATAYIPTTPGTKGQVVAFAINFDYTNTRLQVSVNGSTVETINSVNILNVILTKVVVGSNVQQEVGYFEPTLPIKKVEIYDDLLSDAQLQALSVVGQGEDPLGLNNVVLSKYYETGDIFIPSSLSNPDQDVVGRPLEYKGALAPRAQVVGSGKIVLNGIDQKFQVAYQPTNIKINGVDVTGDWTITDIGGGNWTFEPSVATDVYNMVVNDTYIYPCSELDGTIAYDKSGNNSHATVINAVLPTIRGTQDVYHEHFYNGYWLYKDASDNELQLPVDAGTTVTISAVDFTKVGFVEGFAPTGKYNGASPIKFPDIPEIPSSLRGVTLDSFLLQNTSDNFRTKLNNKGLIISNSDLSYTELLRSGLEKGNYIDKYIGSDLGFVGGLYKCIESYNGAAIQLRRLSDGALLDVYFTGHKINWNDSDLLSWVNEQEVEIKRVYNQLPLALQLCPYMSNTDGQCPTIYEDGDWKRYSDNGDVCWFANEDGETVEHLNYVLESSISQQNIYLGVIGTFETGGSCFLSFHPLSGATLTHQRIYTYSVEVGMQIRDSVNFKTAQGTPPAQSTECHLFSGNELGTSRKVYLNGNLRANQVSTASFVSNAMRVLSLHRGDQNSVSTKSKASICYAWLNSMEENRSKIEAILKSNYNL